MSKLRVHIENLSTRQSVYRITPQAWDAACVRHAKLCENLDVTFGTDGDALEQRGVDAEVMIGVPRDHRRLRERAPMLRWVHATSAGIDSLLPLDWLPPGVALTNNRGAHGVKIEQYMRMAYTLLHTHMPQIIANQRAHRWEQLFSPSIVGKTALIIGLGDLGDAAARAAKQLGLFVIGVRRKEKRPPHVDEVHSQVELDILLPRADFVVVAVPLTPETRQLLNASRLDLMKRSAGLINIARAPIVDYTALVAKLQRREIAGAVLDVVDPEPLPADSPLWDTPNLVITPHISADDAAHYADITLDLWFDNLARYVSGKPLKNRVDPRLGY